MNENKTRGAKGSVKSAPANRPRDEDNGVAAVAACLVKGIPEEFIVFTPETVGVFEQFKPVTIVTDPPEHSAALVVDAPQSLSRWFTYQAPELIAKTLEDQIYAYLEKFPLPTGSLDITSREVAMHLYRGGVEHFPQAYAYDVEAPVGSHILGDFNDDPRSRVPAPDANYASYQIEEGPFTLTHENFTSDVYPQGMVVVRHQKAFHEAARFDADRVQPSLFCRVERATELWETMLNMMREDALRPPSYDHFVKPVQRSERECREDERFRASIRNILPDCEDLPDFQIRHFSVVIRWWHAEKQTKHVYLLPTFRSIAGDVRGRYVEADTVCESFRG